MPLHLDRFIPVQDENQTPFDFSSSTKQDSLLAALQPAFPIAKATYLYSRSIQSAAASATDVFTISGSSTKTIKIRKIMIDAEATAATLMRPLMIRRTTLNSGGTSGALLSFQADPADAAPTATGLFYSANPASLGTASDNYVFRLPFGTTGTGSPLIFDFSAKFGKPITLAGASQLLAVNFGGTSFPAGMTVTFACLFTEE